jgi:hypothetical protein
LPKPYPDELAGSILARGIVHSGLPAKRFMRLLTHGGHSDCSYFLPARLEMIARHSGVAPMRLLWEHTVFPYVTAFKAPREAGLIAWRARWQAAAKRGSLVSLVQSATYGVQGLRFCPHCRDDELDALGETYWHRSHNLPGVHLCHAHQRPLFVVPWQYSGRAYMVGQPHHHREATETDDGDSREAQLRLTKLSVEALQRRVVGADDHIESYRTTARSLGYTTSDGNVATATLCRELQKMFTPDWLRRWGCPIELDSDPWPSRLLRPGTKMASPTFKHLLLRTFLSLATTGEKQHQRGKPGKVTRDYATLDKTLARRVHENLTKLARAGERVPVRELFVGTELFSAWRHDRASFPMTTAAVDSYRAGPIAERQAGGRPRVYAKVWLGMSADATNASS